MADPNRLELVISLKDDSSAGAESIKARYKAIVDDARQMNVLLDKEVERMSASGQRSVDAFIRRSQMAGKDALGKIDVRRDQLIEIAKGDEAVIKQINEGADRIKATYRQRQDEINRAREAADRATATKSQGIAAGKATLAGEAEFQAAFNKLKERDQLVRDLEARAAVAGKKPSERLAMEMKATLAQFANAPQDAKKVEDYYKTIIAAAQKAEAAAAGHGPGGFALRRGVLAVKDALSGSTRGAAIEVTDIFVGTSGSSGILKPVLSGISEITGLSTLAIGAVAGLTAGIGALGIAGVVSAHGLAETGQRIKDFSERTGIHPENVQAFQYAAKAEGADPAVFERAFRGLAQATQEDSSSGVRARKELKALGVDSLYDDIGRLRPTEEIMTELAEGISKLPPGLQQSAASMEIFKRAGSELLPVLLHLKENLAESNRIGGTFTASDLRMFDEWHKQIVKMDEEWERFKARIEKPLAVAATMTIRLINAGLSGGDEGASAARTYGSPFASVMEQGVNDELAKRGLFGEQGFFAPVTVPRPKAPGVPSDLTPRAFAQQRRQAIADAINSMESEAMKDPRYALQKAEKELAELRKPDINDPLTTLDTVREYQTALQKVQSLRQRANPDANKGLQDIIAARQESLNLDAQIAKQRVTDQAEILRAGMGSKSGLMSQQDIEEELALARIAARAETESEVNKRQFRIDTKTGRKIDESNEPGFREFKRIQEQDLEPKRVQEEFNKILTRMLVDSAKFYRARTDESMKHYEEEWHRRQERELEVQGEINKISNEISDRRTQLDIEANDRAKAIALESLGSINAQTLKDKMSLEDQKFAIEKEYADRGLALQLQRLNTERARAIAEIEKKDRDQGINPDTDADTQRLIGLTNEKYAQDADALRQSASDKELSDAMKTSKAKEDLQIQSNRKIYDSLKQDAAGLFDQLVSHTKSWADFAKDLFKSAILTPVKDIFSSQVAAMFTGLITGNKVTFDPVGTGQGKLGGLEGALGRAGLGQPHFNIPRESPFVSSKLESTVEGNAVRVIVTNPAQVGQAHAQTLSSGVGAGLASSFGASILSGVRNIQRLTPSVGSTFETVDSQLITNPTDFGNAYSDTAGYGTSPNGFATMGEIAGLGTPQGIFSLPTAPSFESASPLPNFAGGTDNLANSLFTRSLGQNLFGNPSDVHGTPPFLATGDGSPGSSTAPKGGGLLSTLGHSLLGSIGHLFKRGDGTAGSDTGETDSETGLPLGHDIPGTEEGSDEGSGEGGDSKGVGGPLGGLLVAGGTALAMDGWRRRGALGMVEMGAGGAAIGFKYGGPLGALVGGAIGLGVGALHWAFGGGDEKHAKDLVKQVYGMDINDATAKSIVAIAKQSYGGAIDVAVRSPQVRDLLKLYSQATGQKKAEDQFVQSDIHGASLVEANGKLMQQAIYDNGNAYAYSSQLGTYQGVQTSPLSTYAPNNGVFSGNVQINLNGQAAADVLAGQVVKTATPGFIQNQALAASNSSIGRASQTRMTLSPSSLAG